MDLGLGGRAYVLTGASRGLGLATARALLADGANVVVSGRDGDRLAAAAEELAAPDGVSADQVMPLVADLADPGAAERLVAATNARFGRLDGALVSVGGPPGGGALQVTDDAWRAAFETVFLGALRVTRAVAGACTRGEGGSIVLVLSTSVRAPIGALAISNGLRPGLAMTAKSLADELGPVGVRVNSLLPGRIDTDRVRELDAAGGSPERTRRETSATIPLRRYGEPDEFGKVAAFLLSPAAGYVTGTTVTVDGGATRAL